MRTVKNRKASAKKEFVMANWKTDAPGITGKTGVELNTISMEVSAANPVLTGITIEVRHQLIAEAAYFRAERRRFVPGFELEDWFGAEAEIDMKLSKR